MRNRLFAAAALAGLLLASSTSRAATYMTISFNGDFPKYIQDNGSSDGNPILGQITSINDQMATANGFTYSVLSGVSNAPQPALLGPPSVAATPSNPDQARLQLTSIVARNTGTAAGTLIIELVDNGFVDPTGLVEFASGVGGTLSKTSAGAAVQSVTLESLIDDGSGVVTSGPQTFSSAQTYATFQNDRELPTFTDGPFTLRQRMSITLVAGGSATISGLTAVTPIPEPLAAGAVGSLLLIALRRRKA